MGLRRCVIALHYTPHKLTYTHIHTLTHMHTQTHTHILRGGKSSIQKVVFHKLSPNETLFLESTTKVVKDDVSNSSFVQFQVCILQTQHVHQHSFYFTLPLTLLWQVLYCIVHVLCCTVLHCTVLYTVLYCMVLYCTVLITYPFPCSDLGFPRTD